MNAISLNNLWTYLQGLSLSASNQRWLADRLMESSKSHTSDFSDAENIVNIADETTPYSSEELNARIDEAEIEIERGEGKTLDEMVNGFKKELAWLK